MGSSYPGASEIERLVEAQARGETVKGVPTERGVRPEATLDTRTSKSVAPLFGAHIGAVTTEMSGESLFALDSSFAETLYATSSGDGATAAAAAITGDSAIDTSAALVTDPADATYGAVVDSGAAGTTIGAVDSGQGAGALMVDSQAVASASVASPPFTGGGGGGIPETI